ncbi:MAG: PAS domain S-box protein [Deltaproteobacteria bacterium]|nr:PAS domain S-box protein [Deltaproteobacteria bacterium]
MKISQGALDTKIKYDREDEIGQLAKSFETMMINLKRITASRDELNFEITQRKKTEKKYRNLYENAQIGMFQSTINDGKLVDTNLRMAQILGYASPDECISNYVTDKHYVHSYQRDEVANLLKENSAIDNYKIKVKLDDSTMKWLQFSGVISDDGKIFEGVAADITEQKKHEKIIKNSLGEKEILLKEIHHRVKNNMQIIQSLLNLQLNTLTDSEQKKALIDSGNRIKSMALIHETLYSSEDIAHLDMEVYFDNIIQHLFKIYRSSDIHIDIKVNTDSQDLNMDSCIASGLIINELISNALKYAFIDTGKGNLSISLIRIDEKQGSLIVKDDGCGLPEDFEIEGTASLGLRIVRILAEGQMKGDLIVTSQGGTMFEIKFPISI